MPTLISQPTRIQAAGNKPKLIDEYIGRVNSKTTAASIAHMRSPQGWIEPGQTPDFEEFTIVLKGMLRVEHKAGSLDVTAGQAVIAHAGEWIRYSTPHDGGAEYIAVCLPAFSMETVHRDNQGKKAKAAANHSRPSSDIDAQKSVRSLRGTIRSQDNLKKSRKTRPGE